VGVRPGLRLPASVLNAGTSEPMPENLQSHPVVRVLLELYLGWRMHHGSPKLKFTPATHVNAALQPLSFNVRKSYRKPNCIAVSLHCAVSNISSEQNQDTRSCNYVRRAARRARAQTSARLRIRWGPGGHPECAPSPRGAPPWCWTRPWA
jgi:hypothetical protein